MMWQTPPLRVKPPKYGDERVRTIFAILPHDCEDGFTRWLEFVQVVEKFSQVVCYDEWGPTPGDSWEPVRYYPLNTEVVLT